MATINILEKIKSASNLDNQLFEKFGLKLNPFPKSGIANLSDSDEVVGSLEPVDKDVMTKVIHYMIDALSQSGVNQNDKYISLVIRGDYGTGKTQLLMYMRYLFSHLNTENFQPYVVYIDNPGLSVSELIGSIVSQIGVENFRRYLWENFISYLSSNAFGEEESRIENLKRRVSEIMPHAANGLFQNSIEIDWDNSTISYKKLIDEIISKTSKGQQKEIMEIIKNLMTDCFVSEFEHSTVAEYFYNIVTENISMLKSWGAIVDGSVKNLDKRAVHILNAIVNITKKYLSKTDFIILVDEFEEIATGRLKDSDLDNYLRNLRALIDRERQWCSVFAMTGQAFERLKQFSPPLASRIGDQIIDLKPFDSNEFKKVVLNYLNLARDEISDSISPFTDEAFKEMLNTRNPLLAGSPRFLLKYCYILLQRAAEELQKGQLIDREFVRHYMSEALI